jgi:hypothetical protein
MKFEGGSNFLGFLFGAAIIAVFVLFGLAAIFGATYVMVQLAP